jgi:hypothetical protein
MFLVLFVHCGCGMGMLILLSTYAHVEGENRTKDPSHTYTRTHVFTHNLTTSKMVYAAQRLRNSFRAHTKPEPFYTREHTPIFLRELQLPVP